MVFRLHAIRHAEGIHNLAHDKSILDPQLTQNGIQQSERLSQTFPYAQDVGLVITSPLRRTLETALVGFQQTLDQKYFNTAEDPGKGCPGGAQLLIEPDLQAHSARPCDTGSEQSILRVEFPDLPWDEVAFDLDFPSKEGRYATDVVSLQQRGHRMHRTLEKAFHMLAGTGLPDIAFVSHGEFMKYVVLDDKVAIDGAGWKTFLVTFGASHNMQVVGVE